MSKTLLYNLEQQFDFILGHFEAPIWPRTISSYTTRNSQILVINREEALAWFKAADYKDCKINAYPSYVGMKGLNRQEPNFIFIDLDSGAFRKFEELDKALTVRKTNH
jgi:hypothetical protein